MPSKLRYSANCSFWGQSFSLGPYAPSPDVVYCLLISDFLCSRDTMLKLWDADTGREMRSMGGHTGTITSVFLVPNKDMSSSGKCVFLFIRFVFV